MYAVSVDLSDVDRGVYETVDLRLAMHPSESAEYMATRLLAYCLEYTEGIEFTSGLSDGDEPAVIVRDLTGRVRAWIEVGRTINLTASGSDGDKDPLTYVWTYTTEDAPAEQPATVASETGATEPTPPTEGTEAPAAKKKR